MNLLIHLKKTNGLTLLKILQCNRFVHIGAGLSYKKCIFFLKIENNTK